MIDAANKVKFNRTVFVLKHDKAKIYFCQMPPKQLMDKLGYTDVEKMFENEDGTNFTRYTCFFEGPEWLTEYNELFKQITREDHEERDLTYFEDGSR